MRISVVGLGRAEALLERVGEIAAPVDVQAVYTEYAAPLYWYALTLLGRAEEAEDVVQEVFAALLRRGSGRPIRHTRAYLFKAARRAAMEARKRRSRDDSASEAPLSWIDAETPGADRELAMDIDRALAGLPAAQREVVVLKAVQGLTFREIAEVLGIPANTAASRYRLALARIRARLRGDENG